MSKTKISLLTLEQRNTIEIYLKEIYPYIETFSYEHTKTYENNVTLVRLRLCKRRKKTEQYEKDHIDLKQCNYARNFDQNLRGFKHEWTLGRSIPALLLAQYLEIQNIKTLYFVKRSCLNPGHKLQILYLNTVLPSILPKSR